MQFRSVLALVLSGLTLISCDFSPDYRVSGRVVDAVTGDPVSIGTVEVSVQVNGGFSYADPIVASTVADPTGRFSFSGLSSPPMRVYYEGVGTVDYPIPEFEFGEERPWFPIPRPVAYLNDRAEVTRSSLGALEIAPSCLTLGDIDLSRPLRSDEFLRFGGVFQQLIEPYAALLDSLPLLRPAADHTQIDWELRNRGNALKASGTLDLPACPRHGVLEYEATLTLPATGT